MRIWCTVFAVLLAATGAEAQEYSRMNWTKAWAPPASVQKPKVVRESSTPPARISPKSTIILVELSTQRLTVYENGRVARRDNRDVQGPISSGMQTPKYRTPTGVFRISWKSRMHWSKKYDAPMAYAAFFGPSGEAIHAGAIERPFASHGCVRVSHEMAARLWKHRFYDNAVVIVVERARDFDRVVASP